MTNFQQGVGENPVEKQNIFLHLKDLFVLEDVIFDLYESWAPES